MPRRGRDARKTNYCHLFGQQLYRCCSNIRTGLKQLKTYVVVYIIPVELDISGVSVKSFNGSILTDC